MSGMVSGRHFVDNKGTWPWRYSVRRQVFTEGHVNGRWRLKVEYVQVSRHMTLAGALRRVRRGNRKAGLTA